MQQWGLLGVFDVNSVHELCRRLLEEKDPDKIKELISCLRSVIGSNAEEARLKLEYIVRHWPQVLSDLPGDLFDPTRKAS